MQRQIIVSLIAVGLTVAVTNSSAAERRALTQEELELAAKYLPADSQNCVPHNFKPGDHTLHGCNAYRVLEKIGYTSHIIPEADPTVATNAAKSDAVVVEDAGEGLDATTDRAAEAIVADTTPAVEISAFEEPVPTASAPDAADITFEFDKTTLSDEAKATLASFAEQYKAVNSPLAIQVSGFTDSQGAAAYNQSLSTKRAQTVAEFLQGQGISSDVITTAGNGASQPIAPNTNLLGRAQNRRVELKIIQ